MTAPRSQRHLLVQGGTLVTMDPERRVMRGDVLVSDGRIVGVGPDLEIPRATRLLDASALHVLPGLIQGHVHLGQTLFRGLADDLDLLAWLEQRIWPLEAAHNEESAYWSTLLGAADCLLSGTTTVQDMGLTRGMEGVFRAVRDSGIRAVVGKCLMDTGDGVPRALLEDTKSSLAQAEDMARRWDGEARGRLRAALCPRFVLSCSRELWEGTVALAESLSAPIHTHLLETEAEELAVQARLGVGQMQFLDETGVLDADLRVAHGVLLGPEDMNTLAGRSLKVIHCPSSNAKLGSGIADLVFLGVQENVSLGIGCDGAACNNDLDVLEEIRLAALLQGTKHGAGKFGARAALELATIGGAAALGMEGELGSLEPGKAGDLVVLDLGRPETLASKEASVYSRIVYGAGRDAVRWVVVDGEVLVEAREIPHLDEPALRRRPREEAEALLARAELPPKKVRS